MTKHIGILYFSPTNTTKKICNAVASGMGVEKPVELNITYKDFRERFISSSKQYIKNIDHIIFGAPVYTGKLPIQVIDTLKAIDGKGITCTTLVVYGNRDFGIALRHMVEILSKNHFSVVSAGTFIGQHSYSDIIPVAIGRPDNADHEKAKNLGKETLKASNCLLPEDIPVQEDMFSKSKSYTPLKPIFKSEKCNQCGNCSKYCPVSIISSETGNYRNKSAKKLCTGCMACVNNCKYHARIPKPNFIMKTLVKYILREAAVHRKEPITILP